MNERNLNIILVEDDVNLGFLLVEFLENRGIQVKLYRDGESAFQGFQNGNFNFCIFDVMLPKQDGFTLTKKIKAIDPTIPVIFITARSMKADKLKGYNLGADDYITKPFDEDELLWRIHAIKNRVNYSGTEKIIEYKIGKFKFNSTNHALFMDDNQVKRLTSREAAVLRMLCNSKNNVVRREQLLVSIWGENDYFAGRSLDVFISKLRKYFSADPTIKIENVTKVGFVLNC